jgi:hypothetical protein
METWMAAAAATEILLASLGLAALLAALALRGVFVLMPRRRPTARGLLRTTPGSLRADLLASGVPDLLAVRVAPLADRVRR